MMAFPLLPKTVPPRLITISGKQYAGKDTLAMLIQRQLPDWVLSPIAGAIKALYAEQYHLSPEDLERDKATHRPGLIRLGSWGRAQSPDFWLRQALKPLDAGQNLIVPDVRLPAEYHALRALGACLIRVDAPRAIRLNRGTLVSEEDPTEIALDGQQWHWDAVIQNEGSAEEMACQLRDQLPWFGQP